MMIFVGLVLLVQMLNDLGFLWPIISLPRCSPHWAASTEFKLSQTLSPKP